MPGNDPSQYCRYCETNYGTNGLVVICLKRTPKKKIIDAQVKSFVTDCVKKGIDPQKQGRPMGDNCQGYLMLRNIQQGCDINSP